MARGEATYKPTAAAAEAIDVLAHIFILADLEKKLPEMKGVLDNFRASLTPRQRGIEKYFQAHGKKIYKDLAGMMEKDMANTPEGG